MSELPAANKSWRSKKQMHRFQLGFNLCDRLKVKPAQHSRATALHIFSCFLDAKREAMLHDSNQGSLTCFRHILCHILNDSITSKSCLKIHIGTHAQENDRHVIVKKVAISCEPKPIQITSSRVFSNFFCARLYCFPWIQFVAGYFLLC